MMDLALQEAFPVRIVSGAPGRQGTRFLRHFYMRRRIVSVRQALFIAGQHRPGPALTLQTSSSIRTLTIDLERQCVVKPDGTELAFEVQAFRKFCLLNGLDDIGLTLQKKDKIKAFEAERLATKPWLAKTALV